MPKPKPDQVVRHELVLGRVEREMAELAVGTMAARNIAAALGALATPLLSASVAGVGLAATVWAYFERDDIRDSMKGFTQNLGETLGVDDPTFQAAHTLSGGDLLKTLLIQLTR